MATRKRTAAKTGRTPDLAALKDFVRAEGVKFLDHPNINSVGIGFKDKDGQPTDEVAIQFTVDRKYTPEQIESLAQTPMIPKSFTIGGVVVPTDVVERKYKPTYQVMAERAKDFRKSRQAALTPGISVANARTTAGTLGCIVYDAKNATPYILSNWHVLHTGAGKIGDIIVQPGPYDDNNVNGNVCGRLVRSHLGLAGDCAIASIEGRSLKPEIYEVNVAPKRLGRAELNDKVIKSGRTTAVTHGIVTRVDVVTKMDYDGQSVRIGGFEIGPDPQRPAKDDEISQGGDSGSVWMAKDAKDKPTDIFLGLHFAGESPDNPHEYALACAAHAVMEKLEITLVAPKGAEDRAPGLGAAGYQPKFLRSEIPLPGAKPAVKRDLFAVDGKTVFDYTHFSVAMSQSRRYARWVAYNIDGGRIVKAGIKRVGWKRDPRIPSAAQVGDELYGNSIIDRGHLAKREDLLWGTPEEAARANADSFFFTNASPQHKAFNEGIWKQLEDAIFRETDVADLKVSVFTGPIYRDDDRVYRGVRIPRDFWKIIAWVDEEKGLRASAFVMTQDDLIANLEALGLEKFKVYQVRVADVEARTGLAFAKLGAADTQKQAAGPEAVGAGSPAKQAAGPVRLVESLSDLNF